MDIHVLLNLLVICYCCASCSCTTDLYVLVLLPYWPDIREHASWDVGLEFIPAARVAAKEINQRNDILPDYRINIIEAGHDTCGAYETTIGITNLAHYGIHSSHKQRVMAVAGMYCSPTTQALSPILSNPEVDLVHLSASNSPVFNRNIARYPHLWRLLESAEVHANMMIYFMKEYQWSRIAIMSNQESVYYEGIAAALIDKLQMKAVDPKVPLKPIYEGKLLEGIDEVAVLSELVEAKARIVFVLAMSTQVASLLCKAYEQGMMYPQYLWIIADWGLGSLIQSGGCSNETILKLALEGCIHSNFSLLQNDSLVIGSSGGTYEDYVRKYKAELEQVKLEYANLIQETETIVDMDLEYSAILYDQIWALALALNGSIPELNRRNLSLSKYQFGQPLITKIIEENLRKLSFQGVSSYVEFSEYREVFTPIDIYQIRSGKDELAGVKIVFKNYSTTGRIELNFSSELDDEIPSYYQTVPNSVTATLAVSEILLIVFITVILCLFVKHRKSKYIKARSFKISLIMFIAFYAAIFSNTIHLILSSVHLSKLTYSILCNIKYFNTYNAVILLYCTLYLKIERIHKIFHNNALKMYSWSYSNWMILVKVVALTVIGNVLLILAMGIGASPLEQQFVNITKPHKSIMIIFQYPYCHIDKTSKYVTYFFFLYLGIILFLILYYSSRTKNIKLTEFKETKLINFFLFVSFIILSLAFPFQEVFFVRNKYVLYLNLVQFYSLFCITSFALLMLFVPSILSVLGIHEYFTSFNSLIASKTT